MSVYLLVTLDTKGVEAEFVRSRLAAHGVSVVLVDTGCLGEPRAKPDVPRDRVFAAAETSLEAVQARRDRGEAIDAASRGAARLAATWHAEGKLTGILGLGGSAGTAIATAAMRALPLGIPKLMVSTLASGQVRHYVGDKDILMLNAVVDVAGLNRVSRTVLDAAARAMAGMVQLPRAPASQAERPLIAATMFGVTTPCVEYARRILEANGYEVLVFHATGNGGQAMESLIEEGVFAGVLDITTTELADELVGGVLSAGPQRLTAAGRKGVPQLISVGALDMVNFHAPDTIPERFHGRRFYRHNPHVTLMRTTVEENVALGTEIGRKAAQAKGPTAILLPMQGVSAIDRQGQPFDDPAARQALFDAIRAHAKGVEVVALDLHINDPAFAEAAAHKLLALLGAAART